MMATMSSRNVHCKECQAYLGIDDSERCDYLRDTRNGGVICKACIFKDDDNEEWFCTCCGVVVAEFETAHIARPLCDAGDACPLTEAATSCAVCSTCWREAVAGIPGCDPTGTHASFQAACGHSVCAAMECVGDDADGDSDLVATGGAATTSSSSNAKKHDFRQRCPTCRRKDRRTDKLEAELGLEREDEPLMRNLLRAARSDFCRTTAKNWLSARRERSKPARKPVRINDEENILEDDPSLAETPPCKMRKLVLPVGLAHLQPVEHK